MGGGPVVHCQWRPVLLPPSYCPLLVAQITDLEIFIIFTSHIRLQTSDFRHNHSWGCLWSRTGAFWSPQHSGCYPSLPGRQSRPGRREGSCLHWRSKWDKYFIILNSILTPTWNILWELSHWSGTRRCSSRSHYRTVPAWRIAGWKPCKVVDMRRRMKTTESGNTLECWWCDFVSPRVGRKCWRTWLNSSHHQVRWLSSGKVW